LAIQTEVDPRLMGVKLGIKIFWGKKTDCKCLRTKCWGQYL